MRTPLRLAAFAGVLAVVFAAAAGVGKAIGPVIDNPEPAAMTEMTGMTGMNTVAGLSVAQDGYALSLEAATHPVGTAAPLAFTITGPDGRPVTTFTSTHEKELHLILVRRDTTGYQHLHPERDADGRWSVPLTLPAAGTYKVFADFAPDGRTDALTLAADLSAPGSYEPRPLPAEERTVEVDGYTVTLAGDLVPGQDAEVSLRVSKDGRAVTDLEPYLGAYGHLVALRAGDLAYLHVHPNGEPGDGRTPAGPEVPFTVEVPTDSSYRMYLDFRHEGVVRTAEFTVATEESQAPPPGGTPAHDAPGH